MLLDLMVATDQVTVTGQRKASMRLAQTLHNNICCWYRSVDGWVGGSWDRLLVCMAVKIMASIYLLLD